MTRRTRRRANRGAAALELAAMLPFFCFAALGAFDFALLFRRATAVLECAASGAAAGVALGPSATATATARDSAVRAAVAEAADAVALVPAPAVTWSSGEDAAGLPYVEVVATYIPDGSVGAMWSSGATPIVRKVRLMTPP